MLIAPKRLLRRAAQATVLAAVACAALNAPAARAGLIDQVVAQLGQAAAPTIDYSHRGRRANAGGVEADGAYAVVFPLSAALPNPRISPGVSDPHITQANIHQTICVPGYSRSVRPPESYTEPIKRRLIAEYGYNDRRLRDYELDHLTSIELAGSPTDPRNLFPQPHHVIGGWGSYAKDRLENRLHRLVCADRVPLATAQYEISHDWIAAYRKYIGPSPDNRRARRYGG